MLTDDEVDAIEWKFLRKGAHGAIEVGEFNGQQLVRKSPLHVNLKKWKRELEFTLIHSESETGPRVLYHLPKFEDGKWTALRGRRPVIIMERYDEDCLELLRDILDAEAKVYVTPLVESFIRATGQLFTRLSNLYASRRELPVCVADLRLMNLVFRQENGIVTDVRQIDFDYCAGLQACELSAADLELLLKMCLSFMRPNVEKELRRTQTMALRPARFMFREEITRDLLVYEYDEDGNVRNVRANHAARLNRIIDCLAHNSSDDMRANMTKHMDVPFLKGEQDLASPTFVISNRVIDWMQQRCYDDELRLHKRLRAMERDKQNAKRRRTDDSTSTGPSSGSNSTESAGGSTTTESDSRVNSIFPRTGLSELRF